VTRIVVLDYGSGNIHSVVSALSNTGAEVVLSADPRIAAAADGLVVPGVGAFAACMEQLRAVDADQIITERIAAGGPVLGICVGHQILFSQGVEHGVPTPGLGVYPGVVAQLTTPRVPHMGWNEVSPNPQSQFFTVARRYYFVHSYAALNRSDCPVDAAVAWTNHDGVDLVAAVEHGPVVSTQFHPEKSGSVGLGFLRSWVRSVRS
jgi:glutamine amidotransferase